MQPDDSTELHYLRSERERLRAEKAEVGSKLVILDELVNVSRVRRRVLWTALPVVLFSPLIYGLVTAMFAAAMFGGCR